MENEMAIYILKFAKHAKDNTMGILQDLIIDYAVTHDGSLHTDPASWTLAFIGYLQENDKSHYTDEVFKWWRIYNK